MTSNDDLGTLEETADGWQLRYVRHLDQPPATVWRAFSEPELVEQWFPTTVEGDLVPGSSLRFEFKDHPIDPMNGEVVQVAAPHLLVFTWGEDILRFELRDRAGGTQLTMSVVLGQYGKAARDGAGWHECLGRLAGLLTAGAGPFAGDSWGDVHPAYVSRFGPAASAIGPPPEVSSRSDR
jgi:uncharacterized protein YndB with AHSA1/START domain